MVDLPVKLLPLDLHGTVTRYVTKYQSILAEITCRYWEIYVPVRFFGGKRRRFFNTPKYIDGIMFSKSLYFIEYAPKKRRARLNSPGSFSSDTR